MRKGFVFSLSIMTALTLFVAMVGYYMLYKPEPPMAPDIQKTRDIAIDFLARDLGTNVVSTSVTPSGLVFGDGYSATKYSTAQNNLAVSKVFTGLFSSKTSRNLVVDDFNANNTFGNTTMILRSRELSYEWDNKVFSMNHTTNVAELNITDVGTVTYSNWSPALPGSGDVAVRVRVSNYDSGEVAVNNNTQYTGLFTTGGGQNITVTFGATTNLTVDYTQKTSATQSLRVNSTVRPYVSFGRTGVDTTGTTNPGYTEPFFPVNSSTARHYGSVSLYGDTYNFIVIDANNDTQYDMVFMSNDTDFTEADDDLYYSDDSVVDLEGKAFYIRIDLSGNSITLDKILAIYNRDAIIPARV